MLSPVLDELAGEVKDVKIGKVNVDENEETAASLGIMSIPTLLLYKNGEVVDQITGFRPKEAVEEWINTHK